ncbi:MAG: 3-dehydroquinate synthase [Candidatus Cloacimonetes bacterium]|nr:3-dehydroquinate synthase [Candidatus Cloacimonadota bacterium]
MKFKIGEKSGEAIFSSDSLEITKHGSRIFVIDKKVSELHERLLNPVIDGDPCYFICAREENKTLPIAEDILNFFLANGINRQSQIIGIGGGIVTDITGFAASVFKRGCSLILVPTTFLAMIDAAIGGKTGLNYAGLKNCLGTFFPADKIYIHTGFLKTNTPENLLNGWAECIKIALLADQQLYEMLREKQTDVNADIIHRAIAGKISYCQNDPEDKQQRQHLNLGHTFGHVLESLTGFRLPHGVAVALGIRLATHLSLEKEMIDAQTHQQINEILDLYGFPRKVSSYHSEFDAVKTRLLLRHDKKVDKDHVLNLVLFAGMHRVKIITEYDYGGIVDRIADLFV